MPLGLLQGLDRQREALLANLFRLADGHAAQDVLLWGARGTGKSALVKAGVAAVQANRPGRLALVSVDTLDSLPELFAMLEGVDRAFAVFIDDLGFDEAGRGASSARCSTAARRRGQPMSGCSSPPIAAIFCRAT